MANDRTAKALSVEFDLATMRTSAEKLSGTQWGIYQKLKEQSELHRREKKQDFKINYETRLQAEKQRLIDKAGEKNLEYKPPWAKTDKFNPDQINRQAHTNIKQEYEDRLLQIDTVERDSLKKLLKGAEMRRRSEYQNVKSLDEKFNEKSERRKYIQ